MSDTVEIYPDEETAVNASRNAVLYRWLGVLSLAFGILFMVPSLYESYVLSAVGVIVCLVNTVWMFRNARRERRIWTDLRRSSLRIEGNVLFCSQPNAGETAYEQCELHLDEIQFISAEKIRGLPTLIFGLVPEASESAIYEDETDKHASTFTLYGYNYPLEDFIGFYEELKSRVPDYVVAEENFDLESVWKAVPVSSVFLPACARWILVFGVCLVRIVAIAGGMAIPYFTGY